jgi:polyisoprenoid-binding protein YceI
MMKRAAAIVVIVGVLAGCSKDSDSKPTSSTGEIASAESKPKGEVKTVAFRVPVPGTFQVDPMHSTVLFKVRHLGAGNIYGWFKDFSGTFVIDPDPKKSRVELVVKTATVDTRDDERNGNLTGPDFFNAKQFPELTFRSTGVEVSSSGWQVTGNLTIHGITKPVTFTAAPLGDAKDPQGKRIFGLEARATINRGNFGVSFMPEVIGPEVELIIALEGAAV